MCKVLCFEHRLLCVDTKRLIVQCPLCTLETLSSQMCSPVNYQLCGWCLGLACYDSHMASWTSLIKFSLWNWQQSITCWTQCPPRRFDTNQCRCVHLGSCYAQLGHRHFIICHMLRFWYGCTPPTTTPSLLECLSTMQPQAGCCQYQLCVTNSHLAATTCDWRKDRCLQLLVAWSWGEQGPAVALH